MAKRNRITKIDTSGITQAPLNHPFDSLIIENLPATGTEKLSVPENSPSNTNLGRVVLRRETSGRSGKTVIVIVDFDASISEEYIEELARFLRKHCGCGGTVYNREIEMQGDQPARIRQLLEQRGFRVAGVR